MITATHTHTHTHIIIIIIIIIMINVTSTTQAAACVRLSRSHTQFNAACVEHTHQVRRSSDSDVYASRTEHFTLQLFI